MRIILASASPRRRDLMRQLGFKFDVIPSDTSESSANPKPSERVMELAQQKAQKVADKWREDDLLIIAADTLVALHDEVMGKPKDEADAHRMLNDLAGDTHQVYTGVCLLQWSGKGSQQRIFYEKTDVTFYPMSEEEIRAYIATGDPMDKAGAYGIQSGCAKFIRGIRGDYNNVVGLPVARMYHEMVNFLNVTDSEIGE